VDRAEHPHWRSTLIGVVAVVLVVAGFWFVRARTAQHAPSVRFETAVVDRGPIRAKITATGTVNPIKTVQVGSQLSGRIQALYADFNSVVEPGQTVALIDPRPFQAAVDEARANLYAAHANTRKARASAVDARAISQRNHALAEQNLIAKQTADSAEANARVAEAAVEAAHGAEVQAQAALDAAELNLSYTKIVSPIHGTVVSRNVDVGQTVAASLQAPTLFLIGEDLTQMQVDTNIAEADVGRLEPGMVATFTVDAFPSEPFRGVIREVRSAPQNIQNVITYDAVIDVANPKLHLKPGMTANVEVVYADRADVLRVPNAALRFHPRADRTGASTRAPAPGKKLVWLERKGKQVPIELTPGVSDGTWTEVVGGPLARGERVITEAIGGGTARAM
jgi:HlyD family secretion protein